jgi:pimeloyl-ACP methyl ester carboxylesterase
VTSPTIVRFGAAFGPALYYFHGSPGSPAEIEAFDALAKARGVRLVAIDRGQFAPELLGESYFQALAACMLEDAADQPVRLIGFSLGGSVAVRVASYLQERVASLDLISAAAPLQTGDYLPFMAGKPVFELAAKSPFCFRALTAAQGLAARLAPKALYSALFGSAAGQDRTLSQEPEFKARLQKVLGESLGSGQAGYVRDVLTFVRPWSIPVLPSSIRCRIWHGDTDNWSPPAMADALAMSLGPQVALNILGGRSHYSCLADAMEAIIADSAGAYP